MNSYYQCKALYSYDPDVTSSQDAKVHITGRRITGNTHARNSLKQR